MKIFVTGCAGLLGSNYSRHLLAAGHEVVGIDDLSGGYKAFVPKGEKFTFVKLNLERRKKLLNFLKSINLMSSFISRRMRLKDFLLLFVITIIVIILSFPLI